MIAPPSARFTGLLVVVAVAGATTAATAETPVLPERSGGRVGVGLYGGFGGLVNAGTHPMLGVALRFGGAFTDRFHLLGEFSLRATMGTGTYFEGALDLEGQVFILPRLHARAGFGAKYDIASYGGGWPRQSNAPWLNLVGAVGWDLHRRAERAVSVELVITRSLTSDQDFRWVPGEADPRYGTTFAIGLGFDWF